MTRVIDWPEATLVAAAESLGARDRVAIARTHLVGAYHAGPANLALLRRIAGEGWRVAVPSTLNASSADLTASAASRRPGCHRYAQEHGFAIEVVELLCGLGCLPSLTCAPYFSRHRPKLGERCVWAESNAVLFANAVIGARVLRAPQYLDLAAALTGEAPLAGTLTAAGRRPTAVFDCSALPERWFSEAAGFELLGLWLGQRVGAGVPLLTGLPEADESQLRSLCSAIGTASDCAMLHVAGQTPEALEAEAFAVDHGLCRQATTVDASSLLQLRERLMPTESRSVRTLAVGAPHASDAQVRELLSMLEAGQARPRVVLSLGREVADRLAAELAALRALGVTIVRDTCTYYGSFIGEEGGPVLTPSIKWSLYGRANLGVEAWFGSASECRAALETGVFHYDRAFWRG